MVEAADMRERLPGDASRRGKGVARRLPPDHVSLSFDPASIQAPHSTRYDLLVVYL
jgi:hypothetical protein